jgi:hypothetical protein
VAAKDIPEYRPVSGTGNGHKVRPDLQTKLMAAFISAVFVGTIAWVGTRVSDLSDRMTRVETIVDERFTRLIEKLNETNRRLEALEKAGK